MENTLIAKPYIKKKGLTKKEEKALPDYLHPEGVKSRAERRGRIKFLPTGIRINEKGESETYEEKWRKTATGGLTRA